MTTTLRAQFDGKVFIPQEHVNVPAGEFVQIQIVSSEPPRRGTADALRQLRSRHAVDLDAVEVMEKQIAE